MTWTGRPGKDCVPKDWVCYEYYNFDCAGNPGGMCFQEKEYNGPSYSEVHSPNTCECWVCKCNREIGYTKKTTLAGKNLILAGKNLV